jgi:alpha-1,2-mannosyltransferase
LTASLSNSSTQSKAGSSTVERLAHVLTIPHVRWALGILSVISFAVAIGFRHHGLDLTVYRDGARALPHGHLLYSDQFGAARLPHLLFTYPPFAALLAYPFLIFGPLTAIIVWNLLTIAVLTKTLQIVMRESVKNSPELSWLLDPIALVTLTAALVWTNPIIDHLGFGQVNVFLVFFCAVDFLAPARFLPRGILIGVAAAIKLVPALFIVFFLLVRKLSVAATSALTFVLISGFMWILFPVPSSDFWLHAIRKSSRVGGSDYFSNQAVNGLLSRAEAPGGVKVVVIAAVLGSGLWVAVSCWNQRERAAAFLATGSTMNLVSPISWIHHLVFLCLAVVLFFRESLQRSAAWGWAAAVIYVLLIARLPYVGDAIVSSHSSGALHVAGVLLRETYLVLNLAVLFALARFSPTSRPLTRETSFPRLSLRAFRS